MRTWILLAIAVFSAAVAQSATLQKLPGVEVLPVPRGIEDFSLTNQHGAAMRFSQLRGKTVLVFFGFANCPDICPATLHQLHLVNMSAGVDPNELQVVMISVDGKRDTPAVLRALLKTQSPRFIGLTGDPGKVAGIAAQFRALFVTPPEAGGRAPYNVPHTDNVYLVDPQGRLRVVFSQASLQHMAQATQAVQHGR
jgi:protein SCO1/2